jgi:periplasmic divalent cation tolerance protein
LFCADRQDGRVVPTAGRDDAAQIEGVDVADARYCVLMTTIGSDDEARALCRSLVEAGLVACAQRVPIESLYRWEGELVEDRETLVLLKTRQARSAEVMTAVQAQHPYDVPEVIELPVTAGWPPYLRWVDEQTDSTD